MQGPGLPITIINTGPTSQSTRLRREGRRKPALGQGYIRAASLSQAIPSLVHTAVPSICPLSSICIPTITCLASPLPRPKAAAGPQLRTDQGQNWKTLGPFQSWITYSISGGETLRTERVAPAISVISMSRSSLLSTPFLLISSLLQSLPSSQPSTLILSQASFPSLSAVQPDGQAGAASYLPLDQYHWEPPSPTLRLKDLIGSQKSLRPCFNRKDSE